MSGLSPLCIEIRKSRNFHFNGLDIGALQYIVVYLMKTLKQKALLDIQGICFSCLLAALMHFKLTLIYLTHQVRVLCHKDCKSVEMIRSLEIPKIGLATLSSLQIHSLSCKHKFTKITQPESTLQKIKCISNKDSFEKQISILFNIFRGRPLNSG